MSIILASASPRRKELLEMLGIEDLKIIPAKGEERAPDGLTPGGLVELLAGTKAEEVARGCGSEDVIIAADTIVWFNNRVYGKPHSTAQAELMLSELSGHVHQVYTGVAVTKGAQTLIEHELTKVEFRPLSPAEIHAYVQTGEPMDKAGAYGAQGRGALFVRRIDGDFFNVMGLPLCRLGEMLKMMGVDSL